MLAIKNVPITETVLEAWNDIFLPSFDLLYFEDIETATDLLSSDILIYTRDELQADQQLSNVNVRTAFLTWRVKPAAKYVCIVPNDVLMNIDRDRRGLIFVKQWELGRGQIYDGAVLNGLIDSLSPDQQRRVNAILKAHSFLTPQGEMVALQRVIWDELPWEWRVKLLMLLAEDYTDPSIWKDLNLAIRKDVERHNPYISSKFECFSSGNGPNCFAAALAAASHSEHMTECTIQQWLQPKSFLLGLEVREYKVAAVGDHSIRPEEIQMSDVIVWRDTHGNCVHATYSLGYGLVFNKDGQTMFNPWQVLQLNDVLKNWHHVVESGGQIVIYRKSFEQ